MATTIITKNGTGAPLASDLVAGELAVDLTNKRLYTEDSGGTIIEVGSNPSVLDVDNININGNTIISTNTNGDINLTPNGTGEVNISKVDINAGTIDGTSIGTSSQATGNFTTLSASSTLGVTGATTLYSTLAVTGAATLSNNLTVNGNTTLGNAATDTVTVTADVASNLIPSADDTYDLGASGSEWKDLYIDGTANVDTLVIGASTGVTSVDTDLSSVSASDDTLASAKAIKTYVDSQVGANNELSEVLANGNTTGSTNIVVTAGQSITTDSILETTAAAGVDIDGVLLKDTSVGTDDASGTDVAGTAVTVKGGAGTGTGAGGSLVFQTAPAGTTGSSANAQVTALTIDSAGDATFTGASYNMSWDKSANSLAFGSNAKATFGAGGELELYSDGTDSYIKETHATGSLFVYAKDFTVKNNDGTETMINADVDGGVQLYYNNGQRLSTSNTGVGVTGLLAAGQLSSIGPSTFSDDVTLTGASYNVVWDSSDNALEFADNAKAVFGAGSDLSIYHDGSNSYVKDTGTGDLMLQGVNVRIQGATTGNNMFVGVDNGASTLYYQNAAKLATTSTGIDVTGTIVGDGLTVSPSGTQQILATLRANSGAGGGLVVQTDASDDGLIRGYDSAGNVQLQFDTDGGDNYIAQGNVGIGTTSPAVTLHVNSGSNGEILRVQGADAQLRIDNSTSNVMNINSSGSGDSLALSTNDTERMRIDSSGNVGIKTSSPSSYSSASELVVDTGVSGGITVVSDSTAGGYGSLFFADGTTGNEQYRGYVQYNHNNGGSVDELLFGTAGSEAMRIDSSGRLLINKTATTGSLNLEVQAPTGFSVGSGFYSASTQSTIEFQDSNTTANYKVRIGSETDDMLMFAGGSERMRINSSGVVDIKGAGSASAPSLILAGDSDTGQFRPAANTIAWTTAGTERMRIDSSGNLLVGKTSTSGGIAGSVLAATGLTRLTASGIAVAEINRLGSGGTENGSIVDLKSNGTAVGSIGNNTDFYIASQDGVGLRFTSTQILPCSESGATQNGSRDLGSSSGRFKDLYLSGGVYVGGTGSANYLDDYEEGTFTATLKGATSEPATLITATSAKYTKVGNKVHFAIGFESKDTTGYAGVISVAGLPFTSAGPRAVVNVIHYATTTWTTGHIPVAIIGTSQTTVDCLVQITGSAWASSNHSAGSGRYMWISGTYEAA